MWPCLKVEDTFSERTQAAWCLSVRLYRLTPWKYKWTWSCTQTVGIKRFTRLLCIFQTNVSEAESCRLQRSMITDLWLPQHPHSEPWCISMEVMSSGSGPSWQSRTAHIDFVSQPESQNLFKGAEPEQLCFTKQQTRLPLQLQTEAFKVTVSEQLQHNTPFPVSLQKIKNNVCCFHKCVVVIGYLKVHEPNSSYSFHRSTCFLVTKPWPMNSVRSQWGQVCLIFNRAHCAAATVIMFNTDCEPKSSHYLK